MKSMPYTRLYKLVTGLCALLLCSVCQPAAAQDITLSHDQLKVYEGVFRSEQNKEMNVQFKADSNSLQARLLWNGGQLRLYPKSTVDFYSKEGETVNVKFVKATDGTFNQVSVGGNGLWDRVKNYKAVVKKEISHTPNQLQLFAGLYQFQGDSNQYIQLSVKDNQLILKQHWDRQEIAFVPDSAWDFFNKVQLMFTLHFVKGPDSAIVKVVAFGRDTWNKVNPVQYAPNQLHVFEGKYRLTDDSDDVVQFKIAGNNLIVRQLWDGKETILSPLADRYFYNSAESYPVKFLLDDSGVITMAVVLSGDLFEKIKD